MNRPSLWVALGFFVAWALLGAMALHFIRHSPTPVNHCPPSDAANPWCGK